MKACYWLCVIVLATCSLWAQSPDFLPLGKVISKVECANKPGQSYSLYLPTTYRRGLNFPVIFIFEPLARGPLPVSIMQKAAEKYGYILAASNNSQNGPSAPQLEAGQAMWSDVHERFSIDPKRAYFAGFSGGARLATSFAVSCKGCVAGVAATGAGFPPAIQPKDTHGFVYFAAIGREDFNYPEILELEPKLKDAKLTYRIRHFEGAHEWAPADVWIEAFSWFDLQAMKSGALAKNAVFLAETYKQALSSASDLVSNHQEYEALRTYRQTLLDFDGLLDTTEARQHAAELEKSKAVRDAEKREHQEAELQAAMSRPIYGLIELLLDDPSQRGEKLPELNRYLSELRDHAKNDKDPKQFVAKRAINGQYIYIYETTQRMIRAKDYPTTIFLCDLIINNSRTAPGAHLQKARALAAMNEKKRALAEIQASIKAGLTNPGNLDQPEFASLKGTPDFQSLLASVPAEKSE